MTQRVLHAAQILWPAFLIAGVLEMVVFSWVDPTLLRIGQWQPDAQTTYSLAFFVFWGLVTLSSLLSHWMMKTSDSGVEQRRARRHARRQHVHNHA
ncbi:MAG: hypothetical protein HY836_01160 [Aquabacterium sp.]|uniref:hypothetical protein n=1 Tax=Aquabacterium sp. TaxID=1872578 RepID=UPI0025B8A9C6|nr:hypothetical protein [Aquabacterium sp.]MBI5924187.1 hypothetical protein [Aquabacterium sp.]